MLYEKLVEEIDGEKLSESERDRRIKKLQETIQSQRHLHDDHGPAIIGSRAEAPKFPD